MTAASKTLARLCLSACVLVAVAILGRLPSLRAEATVNVILWFDTEDYLLPASDDAALRVASLLSSRGIRATFKVVGEKARTLERRGRKDVIEALGRHDIGYHSNFHSVHPTPAEYLAVCGWADGVAEFVRREGPGAEDVRRIFGRSALSCYGQPGSSWAPQTLAGLPLIAVAPKGVPCYVDSGSHVGLGGEPFWYCGTLTVYNLRPNETRMDLHRDEAVAPACEEFKKIHDRLAAAGGGLISIFYHPCEWVHREFWDGVNFRRGANPPREQWKAPPQRPKEETEAAFQRFERYIDFQRSLPGVKFVTASDLPDLYPDRVRAEGAGVVTAREVAQAIRGGSPIRMLKTSDGLTLSAADQFVILAELLAGSMSTGRLPPRVSVPSVLGPSEPPPPALAVDLEWPAFRDAALDARDEVARRRQLPSGVFVGTRRIAPADFLAAMAAVVRDGLEKADDLKKAASEGQITFPARVALPQGTTLEAEQRIAQDTPDLFGGWIIHTEGFRAPRILEMARLQAWTLKPAR